MSPSNRDTLQEIHLRAMCQHQTALTQSSWKTSLRLCCPSVSIPHFIGKVIEGILEENWVTQDFLLCKYTVSDSLSVTSALTHCGPSQKVFIYGLKCCSFHSLYYIHSATLRENVLLPWHLLSLYIQLVWSFKHPQLLQVRGADSNQSFLCGCDRHG